MGLLLAYLPCLEREDFLTPPDFVGELPAK